LNTGFGFRKLNTKLLKVSNKNASFKHKYCCKLLNSKFGVEIESVESKNLEFRRNVTCHKKLNARYRKPFSGWTEILVVNPFNRLNFEFSCKIVKKIG